MSTAPFSAEDADARNLRTLSRAALDEETTQRMVRFEEAFAAANPGATLTFADYCNDDRLDRALAENRRRDAEKEDQ